MSASQSVNLALIQSTCGGNPQVNLDRSLESIRRAAADGANIICLQEVFNTVYPCQTEDHSVFDLAEEIPGPTSRALQAVAKELGVVITCSLFEKRTHGLYHNTALTFDVDGTQVGFYRKMHIPDDPNYYEKFYFTPGDLGFTIAETTYGKLGIGVCWDQWYPETARLFALRGAEILLYPTAIGWLHDEKAEYGKSQYDAWQTAMRAHAIANGVFVGAANRVGTEDGIEFWGGSFIANPNGVVLKQARHDAEETVMVNIDLAAIDVVRTHWPFLRDRRIDAYQDLSRRFID